MARTEVAVNNLALNAATALTETALSGETGASGHSITTLKSDSDVRIIIKNTGSATGLCWINYGGYLNSAQGNLEQAVGPNEVKAFQLDGSRFRQTDAMIDMDLGITGTMYAFQ